MIRNRCFLLTLVLALLATLSLSFAESPIDAAMDSVVARLYAKYTPGQLLKMDEAAVQQSITPEERHVFATKFWCFDANVPVVVSVIRDTGQETPPFWLGESGFVKTDLRVKNEEYTYDVWQKKFPAGRVELGVPGFECHRPNYFVAVGAQNAGDKVELTNFFPADQQVFEMRDGAYTYYDWPDLLLKDVPAQLKGQILLPTFRGRARESHLVKGFRKTPYPSSEKGDEVVLTWNGDPRTTQAIQWRTSPAVETAVVRYKEKNAADWLEAKAERHSLTDRMIVNDRQVNHFTATLRDLKPGTHYLYSVGDNSVEFSTAPATDAPFTFFYLSDTHNTPPTEGLLRMAAAKYPDAAFCTIAGDLVGMGQYRDNWDSLFHYGRAFFAGHALMPCVGNHDAIDGLGANLYCAYFDLPENGPAKLAPHLAYSFQYSNAEFIMPDVTSPIEDQTSWLDDRLSHATAAWKFVEFHFPPYGDDNPDIIRDWIPLFDKYHVDFVLCGHIHNYMRSWPMKAGKRVESNKDGTIYMITVSTGGGGDLRAKPDYAAAVDTSGTPLCTVFSVEHNRVVTRTHDKAGKVIDEAVYEK